MSNSKATKRALLTSVMALVLCFAMLTGTTFAWFTDTETSGNNKIIAGNLDVQLLMWDGDGTADTDYIDIGKDKSPIFGTGSIAQNNNAETLWEPGKTQVAYLAIKNNGNLALKYQVSLDVKNVAKDLYKVMEYVIVPDAKTGSVDEATWSAQEAKTVTEGPQLVSAASTELPVGTTHYFALAIHMQEEATNDYEEGQVAFDIIVNATQLNAESDAFGTDYDVDAALPTTLVSTAEELADALSNGGNIKLTKNITTEEAIVIPAGVTATLNLGGNTITSTLDSADDSEAVAVVAKGTAIIKNGNISTSNGVGGVVAAGSEAFVVLEDVTVTATGANLTSDWNASAVQAESNGKVVINSGNYSSTDASAVIVESNGGSVTINGGTFTVTGNTDKSVAARVDAWGDGKTYLTINGGTFNAEGDNAYALQANYVNCVATVNGGVFNGEVDACGYGTYNIYINGGTFNDTIVQPGGHQNYYRISGGKFVEDLEDAFAKLVHKTTSISEDCEVTDNGDGTWTVSLKPISVATEGELRLALHDAPVDGNTVLIVLNEDITLSQTYNGTDDNAAGDTIGKYSAGSDRAARLVVKAGQNIVLDLNGHTVKKSENAGHGTWGNIFTDLIGNFGTLTVKDSSDDKSGKLISNAYGYCGGSALYNYAGGTMTVEDITVDGNSANSKHSNNGAGEYVIVNKGTMVVDGAVICDTAWNSSLIVNNGDLTIKGGAVIEQAPFSAIKAEEGNILIDGATIKSDSYGLYAFNTSVIVNDAKFAAVNDGKNVKLGLSEKYNGNILIADSVSAPEVEPF